MNYIKTFESKNYSDEMRKVIDDIFIELKDSGFKYFFNDIKDGFAITLELKYKSYFDIELVTEPFLMLEDYIREEWDTEIKILYQYNIGSYTFGVSPETRTSTITEAKPTKHGARSNKVYKLKFITYKFPNIFKKYKK